MGLALDTVVLAVGPEVEGEGRLTIVAVRRGRINVGDTVVVRILGVVVGGRVGLVVETVRVVVVEEGLRVVDAVVGTTELGVVVVGRLLVVSVIRALVVLGAAVVCVVDTVVEVLVGRVV